MKTKVFEVPVDSMVEFTELLEENELEGTIIGVAEDSEIKISVDYEHEDRGAIFDLMELIDGSEDD
jgi:hypothetical protein